MTPSRSRPGPALILRVQVVEQVRIARLGGGLASGTGRRTPAGTSPGWACSSSCPSARIQVSGLCGMTQPTSAGWNLAAEVVGGDGDDAGGADDRHAVARPGNADAQRRRGDIHLALEDRRALAQSGDAGGVPGDGPALLGGIAQLGRAAWVASSKPKIEDFVGPVAACGRRCRPGWRPTGRSTRRR